MAASKEFLDECLKAHNAYRTRHQAAHLKLNPRVSSFAQSWADRLATSGSLQHHQERTFEGQRLGENIAMRWTSSGADFTGQQVADQWYDDLKKYDFKAAKGSAGGHFSQMVWQESREVGFGKAKSSDGKWFVVGNYLPTGNVQGKYRENVLPAK